MSLLFQTKSLERIKAESEGGEQHLKKTLGPFNLVALGIGAIIGAGLFSLTGIAAADNAGSADAAAGSERRTRRAARARRPRLRA